MNERVCVLILFHWARTLLHIAYIAVFEIQAEVAIELLLPHSTSEYKESIHGCGIFLLLLLFRVSSFFPHHQTTSKSTSIWSNIVFGQRFSLAFLSCYTLVRASFVKTTQGWKERFECSCVPWASSWSIAMKDEHDLEEGKIIGYDERSRGWPPAQDKLLRYYGSPERRPPAQNEPMWYDERPHPLMQELVRWYDKRPQRWSLPKDMLLLYHKRRGEQSLAQNRPPPR